MTEAESSSDATDCAWPGSTMLVLQMDIDDCEREKRGAKYRALEIPDARDIPISAQVGFGSW